MSKILDATCDASGVVTADSVVVPEAEVLSEGKQQSSGLLFLEGPKARYFPSSATDIKSTIEKTVDALEDLASVLNTIATTLTSIGANMTGDTTAPPGDLGANVATIISKATEITAVQTQLETLKGALK
jgi:uncharacterized protein YukE